MAQLREVAESCGFTDVRTYVQSGNAVFRTSASASRASAALRAAIKEATTLDPEVAVRTAAELRKVIDACPFEDTSSVHVTFLVDGAKPAAPKLDADAFAPERFETRGRETYLYLPNGIGRSKLAQALATGAKLDGTTRNWRTVTALASMASDLSE
jgi:uncharacterized protein (DUF1697 family)